MPNEALWVQQSGVDYDASEDRKLIWALATPGVSRGLVIAKGTGRQVTVSAGVGIVDDGSGQGGYVAYRSGVTTLTIPASATQYVFLVVDPTTGDTTVTAGTSLPTNPSLTLGSAATNASAVTTVTNSAPKAVPPAMNGDYVPATGGTMRGQLVTPDLLVPGILQANSNGVNAPQGVRLGGVNRTARHFLNCAPQVTPAGSNNINNEAWETVVFNPPAASNNVTDFEDQFGHLPMGSSTTAIHAGPPGTYMLTGYLGIASKNNVGQRMVRARVRHEDGSDFYYQYLLDIANSGRASQYLNVSSLFMMKGADYLQIEIWQNSGLASDVSSGRIFFRLVQAD